MRLRSKPTNCIEENKNSHHSEKFGDNRYCGKSDSMDLICNVTLYNHLFK